MVPLHEILKPRHVDLELPASDPMLAVAQLAGLLQGDNRITNWAEFKTVLCRGGAERLTMLNCGAVLCHARTEGVTSILMAAGRLATPVADLASGHVPGETFQYVFVIGLPPATASEYLRVVGALARALKNEGVMREIETTTSPEEFVEVLSRGELAL